MKARVLIVEDQYIEARNLKDILQNAGYWVFPIASSVPEALEIIGQERPDLVLLDIQMPEMDGYAVLREIRNDPALQGLRVVALTAYAMQGDRERALEAGFDDYLTKPVSVANLKAQLDPPAGIRPSKPE